VPTRINNLLVAKSLVGIVFAPIIPNKVSRRTRSGDTGAVYARGFLGWTGCMHECCVLGFILLAS